MSDIRDSDITKKKTQNTNVNAERSVEYRTRSGSISISTNDPVFQRHKNQKEIRDVMYFISIYDEYSLFFSLFSVEDGIGSINFVPFDSITFLYNTKRNKDDGDEDDIYPNVVSSICLFNP